MTSQGVATPYRSALDARRDGFAHLLRAEWTKFRTVRGWVVGMLLAVLVTVLIGLFGSASGGVECVGPNGQACTGHIPPSGPDGEAVSDRFYFVHQPLAGDGTITARVTSLAGSYPDVPGGGPPPGAKPGPQPWAKAGVIVKAGTGQGATYAAVMVTGAHGVRMQHDFTGDRAGTAGAASAASPRWLRLTRSGDTVTGYDSVDGTHWTTIGSVELAGLPDTAQVGLFATSPGYEVITDSTAGNSSDGGPTLATARFDQVSLRGSSPKGEWTGDRVDEPVGGDGVSGSGFQQSGGEFTVSGSGDIAPDVAGPGAFRRTVENSLVGVSAGLIAVVVVATMFVTAEYRRGLIRTTLGVSPRRGRVLAAKAVVVGAVAFVTGLVSAAVTVPLVGRLAQHRGLYVYPVSRLTELRVMVGTGALFAVSAVLALAVGTLLRRGAGAVTAAVAAIVLPYFVAIASVLPDGATQWLTRLTPAAAFAVQQTVLRYPQVAATYTVSDGYFPLAPWAGLGVLCGYAALALTLAAVVLRRRDA